MDYDDILDRAIEESSDETDKQSRFSPPEPELRVEGSFTYYDNFEATADYLNRDTDHLLRFFQQGLATNANQSEGGRVEFTGTFRMERMETTLNEYVEDYVMCNECESPDTHFESTDGATVIACEACGARNSTPE